KCGRNCTPAYVVSYDLVEFLSYLSAIDKMRPSPRSGRQHKAWGGARLCERNPRIAVKNATEPAKRATAHYYHALSPASRAQWLWGLRSWGYARKASLHPRLYAHARFAG